MKVVITRLLSIFARFEPKPTTAQVLAKAKAKAAARCRSQAALAAALEAEQQKLQEEAVVASALESISTDNTVIAMTDAATEVVEERIADTLLRLEELRRKAMSL